MKRLLLLLVSAALLAVSASATPCAPGTLMGYINMSPSGCLLGNVQVFGFSYEPSASGGAQQIGTDQIGVTPLLAPNGTVGLMFAAPWGVHAGQTQGSTIQYQLASPNASVQVQQVMLDGSGFRAGMFSSVAVHENFAAAATTGALQIYLTCTDVCSSETSSNLVIPPVSSLVVDNVVTLQSKQGGATMSRFADWFVVCLPCS